MWFDWDKKQPECTDRNIIVSITYNEFEGYYIAEYSTEYGWRLKDVVGLLTIDTISLYDLVWWCYIPE